MKARDLDMPLVKELNPAIAITIQLWQLVFKRNPQKKRGGLQCMTIPLDEEPHSTKR